MKSDLENYRVSDELYHLLCQWGRNYMIGAPRLSYSPKSPTCGEYLSPGYREERPTFNMDDFDRITAIIDNTLSRPKVESLKCRFRYHEDGKPWGRKQSARHMGISVDEYLTLLRQAMRRVDVNFNGDE